MKQLDSAQKKKTLYGMDIYVGSVCPPFFSPIREPRVELFSAKNMLILWMVVVALGGVSTLFLAFNIRYEWLAFFAVFALSEFIALNLVLRKEI